MIRTFLHHTSGVRAPELRVIAIRGVIVLFAVLTAATIEAATYYVSTSGSDNNSCASAQSVTLADQKATIAAGVTCLSAGDTLFIHGGTYTGRNNVIDSQTFPVRSGTSWSNPITISGVPGETVTIVPPYNVSGIRLTTGSPSYLIMQDFVIDMVNSGPGTDADGIFLHTAHHNRFQRIELKHGSSFGVHYGNATPFNEMLHCRIHDVGYAGSASTSGHGLYITGSDNLFEANDVYNNQGYGLHIYNNSGTHDDPSRNIIRNNYIHGNGVHGSPAYGIVIAWGDGNVIANNVIAGNRGGIQIYTGSTNTAIYHNTIFGNNDEGMVLQYYAAGLIVRNNIVYGNGAAIVDYGGTAAAVSDHNLMTNPAFTNATAGDFRLQSGSSARDAGASIASVTTDYTYAVRPQGAGYDIGAFEFVAAAPPGPGTPPGPPSSLTLTRR